MYGDRPTTLILLSVSLWGTCLSSNNLAQIIPDNSLSNESSVIVEDATINQNQIVDLIEGGATRDKTLFHSFQEFNVLLNQQIYFANPNGIEQIVTRVTGNNPSNILGTLGINGSANLFLLNPNGILFGENATLDLQGSLLATTAESVIFDDDLVYSATNPEVPLLNIGIPVGIQMGANAGRIEVQGTGHQLDFNSSTLMPTGESGVMGLEVSPGNTLALLASELNFNSGNLTASAGTIELAAIAQSGEIELEQKDNIFEFDYQQIDNFGNINLFEQSSLDVRGGRDLGSVTLRGRNITINNGSTIIASKLRPGNSKTEGEINLIATNSLNLVNNVSVIFPSSIFTQIEQNSNKPGIDINIQTDSLKLENNALIISTVTNKGRGGNININARSINLIDGGDLSYSTGIYSQVLSGAKGDGGIITVEVDNLQLLDGQTVIYIDDEDDLEDIIGEDRAENLEDFIEDREDQRIVIGRANLGKRTLVLKDGGEITSSNEGNGDTGIGIVIAESIQLINVPEVEPPDTPEVETPDTPEVEPPDTPEVETPDLPEVETPDVPEVEPPDTPEVETPDTPEVETPDTPEVETPDTPEVEPPDLPEVEPPDLPEVETPALPEVETPALPEVETPDTPEVETPALPEVEPPDLPEVETPDLPEVETPDTPEVETPDTPEVETPDTPEVETPDTPEVETPDTPEVETPDTPEVEPPDLPEVEPPDTPEVETPEESEPIENMSDSGTYTFDLGNGKTIVIDAEEFFKIGQLEPVADFVNNSTTRKRKPIEVYASSISTTRIVDPSFDSLSACRVGGSNFVVMGKGGIAENPFQSVIQNTTVPDLESNLAQSTEFISSPELNNATSQIEPILEASTWQVNQKGKIELLAASQSKRSNPIAKLPDCLSELPSANTDSNQ
ncbi:MAG: filamentous hemagglutinin N-terminal domain-containing protein [Cyanobacteria bacterium J06582_2]